MVVCGSRREHGGAAARGGDPAFHQLADQASSEPDLAGAWERAPGCPDRVHRGLLCQQQCPREVSAALMGRVAHVLPAEPRRRSACGACYRHVCDPPWCAVPLASSKPSRSAGSRVHDSTSAAPPTLPTLIVFVRAATVENPLEFIGQLLREAPEPEEAVPPRGAQTRSRPAALEVPGGGAGATLSPRAGGVPPASPRSPGTLLTPASKSQMPSLSLQSPSPRGLDSARSSSYDTISVR